MSTAANSIQLGPTVVCAQPNADSASLSIRTKLASYLELGKARLSAMVVASAAVGYLVASRNLLAAEAASRSGAGGSSFWSGLLTTLLGTMLAALGANAFNQWLEAPQDARMLRTRGRPLPAGLLSNAEALAFAAACSLAGPLLLAWYLNLFAGLLALATIALYVLLYTPLKLVSPLNTLVGAVVGALPPLIGSAAAAGSLTPAAWLLAMILFCWQIPHFLALCWLYREDYRSGGFRMLPGADRSGWLCGAAAATFAMLLLPASALLGAGGVAGVFATVISLLSSLYFAALALRFWRHRTDRAARRLFFASLLYLPLTLLAITLDAPSARSSPNPPAHFAARAAP